MDGDLSQLLHANRHKKSPPLTGMQLVAQAADLFGQNHVHSMCDPRNPTMADLAAIPDALDEIKCMTGAQRKALLERAGVPKGLPTMLYLRAIQHLSAAPRSENINATYVNEDLYNPPPLHPYRATKYWSPSGGPYGGVLGNTYSLSSLPPLQEDTPVDDEVSLAPEKKSSKGIAYNGLWNQGSTCYLSSLLQSLYHLGAFRSMIYSINTEAENAIAATHHDETDLAGQVAGATPSIPFALQRLFYALQVSGRTQATNELTTSFGWSQADSFIQHDIHELTRKLIDNLEAKLAKKAQSGEAVPLEDNPIRKLFTGKLENYIEVDAVNHRNATQEVFYDLQLMVKGMRNIYSSFDALVKPNHLSGHNKYLWEKPDGTKEYHDARMGARLLTFPPVLLMHLTRFEYDPEVDGIGKVNSRYEFYDEINLHRYSPHLPETECIFQLHSILVHSGSDVGYGHYYCFVKAPVPQGKAGRTHRWFKFDDNVVTKAHRNEVFGSNFGGNTLGYWGTSTPCTNSAYMLVYIKKSAVADISTVPSVESIPAHLKTRYEHDELERARKEKEAEEAHLYTKVHLIDSTDLADHPSLFRSPHPRGLVFPPQKSARILNSSKVMEALGPMVEERLHIPPSKQFLWCVSYNKLGEETLHRLIRPEDTMESITGLSSVREICILVSSLAETANADVNHTDEESSYVITHHSIYKPDSLEIAYIGSIVSKVANSQSPAVGCLVTGPVAQGRVVPPAGDITKAAIDDLFSVEDPRDPAPLDTAKNEAPQPAVTDLPTVHSATLPGGGLVTIDSLMDRLSVDASVVVPGVIWKSTDVFEVMDVAGRPLTAWEGGCHFVWQQKSSSPFLNLYPDVPSFQTFSRNKVTVKLRQAFPPYKQVATFRLADDMPYEYVQRYCATVIPEFQGRSNPADDVPHEEEAQEAQSTEGEFQAPPSASLRSVALKRRTAIQTYDHIRFSRHNIETNAPFFIKVKKRDDNSNLRRLLTCRETLTDTLYYEVGKFAVTDLENSNPLQFDYFNDKVQYLSTHQILLPPPGDFTVTELLVACAAEIGLNELPEGSAPLPDGSPAPTLLDIASRLQLVDIWKGSMYRLHTPGAGRLDHMFEESAEYRVEPIPQPLPIALCPEEYQMCIPVHHCSVTANNGVGATTNGAHAKYPPPPGGQKKVKVVTHGDPFYLWIDVSDSLPELMRRVAARLGVSEQYISDWKPRLVSGTTVVPLDGLNTAVGEEIQKFLRGLRTNLTTTLPDGRRGFNFNTSDSSLPFFGLEHAPIPQRRGGPANVVQHDLRIHT